MVLHRGSIAEMRTGGKTLVATFGFLNALSGKGVHVVTVNDYLATRDCEGWVDYKLDGFDGRNNCCMTFRTDKESYLTVRILPMQQTTNWALIIYETT